MRPGWYHYQNLQIGYTVDVPQKALVSWKGKPPADGPKTGFGTYRPLTEPSAGDFDVIFTALPKSCSPSLMGSTHMQEISESGGKAQWGKVDDAQASSDEPYPDALCDVPTNNCTKEEYWTSGCKTGAAAYALCSEKGGKTVLICISQQTDDSALAKKIFDTFRWTK
jgi:hypothetical protein